MPKAAIASPGRLPGPAAARLPDGLRYAIPVIPDLEAGHAGWCSGPEFTVPAARTRLIGGGGACAPASAHSVAIVAGALPSGASADRATRDAVWVNWWVVSDRVAVIKIGAAPFVPRPDAELAPDWHAEVTFTRGLSSTFRFYDHRGRPIDQAAHAALPPVAVRTVNPRHPPSTVCSLGSTDLPGVTGQWEVVADAAPRPAGRPKRPVQLRPRLVRVSA